MNNVIAPDGYDRFQDQWNDPSLSKTNFWSCTSGPSRTAPSSWRSRRPTSDPRNRSRSGRLSGRRRSVTARLSAAWSDDQAGRCCGDGRSNPQQGPSGKVVRPWLINNANTRVCGYAGRGSSWSAQTAAGWSTRSSSTQVLVAPLEPAAVDGAVVVNAMT
jgi:hypothetical protein